MYSATFDCPWKMLPTNCSPPLHIGYSHGGKSCSAVSKKDISMAGRCIVFQGTRTSSESQAYPHIRNLHFLRLAAHHGHGDRSARANSEHGVRSESHGSGMMMFRGRLLSLLSPRCPPFVYHSVDRSSSTSLAGNTNRIAKITLMSQTYRERGDRERERER